jgi:hypothetical protein
MGLTQMRQQSLVRVLAWWQEKRSEVLSSAKASQPSTSAEE